VSETKKEKRDVRTFRTTAPAEKVWAAWAQPEHISGWFSDDAKGKPVPGDVLTLIFSKFGMEIPQEVVEADPGKLLVLKGYGPGGVPYRQEVRITQAGGETVMELIHSGFGDATDFEGEEYQGQDSGWIMAFGVLREYLEKYYGKKRTNYMAMRPATFTYDALQPFFRDRAMLAKWLGDGAVGAEGQPVNLELTGWGPLQGRVAARSKREVAISWDQIQGILELKAFSMGPNGTALSLRASSWAAEAPKVAAMESWMAGALERLAAALAAGA
jgi:uncharacterized protein YndB with AHSA1/START domain